MLPSIIALDGPASAGKSTIGMLLAGYLNYLFFDTGNMYRAVTLAVLQRQAKVTNELIVNQIADVVKIDVMPISFNDGRQSTIMLDGNDVTWDIRSSEVDANVSQVSAYSHVRQVLTAQMREIGKRGRVIMAGRDIGTVVLPDADLKLYLIASPEERARRRHAELEARGVKRSFEDILSSIRERDHFDSHREHAPLKPADDALIVDTTGLNIEQSATKLLSVVKSFKPVSV
ncbi:MAG: (d)CMP kinase [Chloroflexota bacterium]